MPDRRDSDVKALPLTSSCFSPLPGLESKPGHVRKLPVTWGQAVVFAGYSGFLHHLQLASHDYMAAIWQKKVTKNEISNSKFFSPSVPVS